MDVGGRDSLGGSRMSCFPHPWPCLAHPVREWGGGGGPALSAPPLPAQTYSPQCRTGRQSPQGCRPDLRESTAVLENPVNLKPNPTENSKTKTTPAFSVRVCRASVSGRGQDLQSSIGPALCRSRLRPSLWDPNSLLWERARRSPIATLSPFGKKQPAASKQCKNSQKPRLWGEGFRPTPVFCL